METYVVLFDAGKTSQKNKGEEQVSRRGCSRESTQEKRNKEKKRDELGKENYS